MKPAPVILNEIRQYTDAVTDILDTTTGFVAWLKSLRDPVVRARRLRRKAARLWRMAHNVEDRRPDALRIERLERRAADAWNEANELHSLHVHAAIRLDKGAV